MRKSLLLTILCLAMIFAGYAQVFFERNLTTTGNTSSQFGSTSNRRVQQLYTQADLNNPSVAGYIDQIFFMYHTTTAQSFTDLEVYIGQTSATALTTDMTANFNNANMIQVLAPSVVNIPAGTAGDWFSIPLSTQYFVYDPAMSIVVETRWTASPTSTSWAIRYGTADAAGTNKKYINSSPTGTTGTVSTFRANFRFRVIPSSVDDAGIVSVDGPVTPAPPGSNTVTATIKNFGTATLTSAQINWSIDNVTQTPYPWTGSLTQGASVSTGIGSFNFPAGTHQIKVWASAPNGNADGYAGNDEANRTTVFCQPVSGTVQVNTAYTATDVSLGQYKSLGDLATQLSACGVSGNVIVNVVPNSGPYTEQVVFNTIPNTSSTSTVTINGNGNTVTFLTNTNDRHVIRLNNVSWVTIDSFIVTPQSSTSSTIFYGIHVYNTCSNITVKRIKADMTGITSTLTGGIVASGATNSILTAGEFSNISFLDNTTTGGGYGLSFSGNISGNPGLIMNNNKISDYSSSGIHIRGSNGAILSNNTLTKSLGTAGTNAINVSQSENSNAQVFGNIISHPQTSVGTSRGIYLAGGSGHKVYNNLIYDIRAETGTIFHGIAVREGAPQIYFNTIIFNHTGGGAVPLNALSEELSNTGSVLRNNIFVITQPTSGVKAGIALASTSTVATSVNSNNNVFYMPSGNVATRGATTYTLATWRTASGEDVNSFETNPDFQGATAVPTSGVINNQGDPSTGITTDITGATRGPVPDPGAYEFSPAADDAAITGFVTPTLPHCGTTLNVEFTLTNAGSVPLTSATINWTVNGVPQTAYNWVGNIAPGNSTPVVIGTAATTGSTSYTYVATVTSPNGQADVNPANNSFTYSGFRRGMEGAFTINNGAPASSTNYLTFQTIANDLSLYGVCGHVSITVVGGPYTEQVIFNAIPGTSQTSMVTLSGGNNILQFNPTVQATDHILKLNGVNWMTVENLNIKSLHATQGRGIQISNAASNLFIRNNRVEVSTTNESSTAFGIIAADVSYLLDGTPSENLNITDNTVIGGYTSIQITGDGFNTLAQKVRNSRVANNTVQDFFGFGIYLNYTDRVSVQGNIVHRPTRDTSGSDSQTPAAIYVSPGSTNFLIDKNHVFGLHTNMAGSSTISRGIYVGGTTTAPSDGTVQNNLVYGMTNNGSQYGIQDNATTGPINIHHNTVVLDGGAGSGTSNAIYLGNSTVQNGTSIKNNIFYVTRGGTGVKRIIEVANAASVFTSDYNVTWLSPAGGTAVYGKVGSSTNYTTLTDWQTGVSKDINSVNAEPMFINLPAGDLKPTNTAVDGSTMNTSPVGVPDDFFGVVRGINPDPGAIEFSAGVYTFLGTGNWSDPANWNNNVIPPSPLPSSFEIVIDPASGSCILNVPYTVGTGGKLTVKTGKSFIIQGNLTIQ